MITRRELLWGGGSLAVAFLAGSRSIVVTADDVVAIEMKSDVQGSHVSFDPIGVLVRSGQTVRWTCASNVHTASAYHPKNGGHSLRIPDGAEPWDSKYLLPGQTFEVTLTVEGVYDYFCLPHEMAGMVGRIIVGKPGDGPGTLPFDYFRSDPSKRGWRSVPKIAQDAFPDIAEIMKTGRVPRT
jgi:plastocyanin